MKFTDRKVRNLKPKEARYEEWESNGLGIRIAPSGRKSWIFMYRFGGRARRMTLGTYPAMTVAEAHKIHGKALSDLEKGIDPGAKLVIEREQHRKASTVQEFSTEYIEKWAKRHKRSWKEDERMLDKDVLPKIGRLKVADVNRHEIIKILDDVTERGALISANRTFEVVRKMFNFAVERGVIDVSPCLNIKAPGKENKRDRFLSDEEIAKFWHSLRESKMSESTRLALKLQLVTAQRRGEVAQMEWKELDTDTSWWVIPAHKAKNNIAHRVPLSELAIELLQQAKEHSSDSAFVFPSPIGDKPISPGAITRAIGKNRQVLGIDEFKPHDLRRTAASQMTKYGIPRLVVAKILNHVDSGITAVYDRHSYDDEKREALTLWADKVIHWIEKYRPDSSEQTAGHGSYNWCVSQDEIIKSQILNIRILREPFDTLSDSEINALITKLDSFLGDIRNNSLVLEHFGGNIAPNDLDLLIAWDKQIALNNERLVTAGLSESDIRWYKKAGFRVFHLLEMLALKASNEQNFGLASQAATLAKVYRTESKTRSKGGKKGIKDNAERDKNICLEAQRLISEGMRGKAVTLTILEKTEGIGERQIQNILNSKSINWQ